LAVNEVAPLTRATPLKTAGNAGEITPRLHARTDFNKYDNAWETVENFIPLAEGGMQRRSGTRYVAEVEDSAVKGRLFHFEFSITQAYVGELADTKLRFYRNQGQITVADTDGGT